MTIPDHEDKTSLWNIGILSTIEAVFAWESCITFSHHESSKSYKIYKLTQEFSANCPFTRQENIKFLQ
jgi:hypothetical protein